MNNDNNEIKIDLKWFDDMLANLNNNQLSLFDDNGNLPNTGAATISQAASSNIWPYTITGTSGTGTSLGNGGYTFNNSLGWDTWNSTINPGLKVNGDAEFDGDIKLKGKSLSETLDKIEQRLAILHPNEKLEASWEKLKELGDAYRALEKDILEKEKIWDTLKK